MNTLTRNGLSLLELLVAVSIVAVISGMLLAGIQRVRAAADRTRCSNTLRQVGLALHQYHNSHNTLPPGVTDEGGSDPFPFMSWQPRLLPYLERDAAWQETVAAFKADRNFLNDPPHAWLTQPMPP